MLSAISPQPKLKKKKKKNEAHNLFKPPQTTYENIRLNLGRSYIFMEVVSKFVLDLGNDRIEQQKKMTTFFDHAFSTERQTEYSFRIYALCKRRRKRLVDR